MKLRSAIMMVVMFTLFSCSSLTVKSDYDSDNESKTGIFYEKMVKGVSPNTAQLNLFFSKMPKGGDLHNHYSGSIYVETYLDWVKDAGYWIDENTLYISKTKTDTTISVDQLRYNNTLYRKLLTLWSDKDYHNHYHEQLPPDASFFNTFGYFGPIATNYNKGLNILKERAIKENVSCIELMLKSVGYSYNDESFDQKLRQARSEKEIFALLDELSLQINADKKFQDSVNGFIETVQEVHKGIDDDQFMMRYQTYTSRNSVPSKVFSGLYSAFKAVDQSDLLVAVNIVGPENGIVAIEDYNLHMQMFAYLHKKFPDVHRSLHAGELTLGMVRPKNLKFHITQALNIAKAQRIGHGVDLPFENNPINLLQQLKEKAVIEICFTSNDFILGVKDNKHPYLIYSAYDVPMVICTDDSGVSRNNLTDEYVLLATRYQPSYQTIKNYVYNSIKYSFFSAQDKAMLTNSLDLRFAKFEDEIARYSDLIVK